MDRDNFYGLIVVIVLCVIFAPELWLLVDALRMLVDIVAKIFGFIGNIFSFFF